MIQRTLTPRAYSCKRWHLNTATESSSTWAFSSKDSGTNHVLIANMPKLHVNDSLTPSYFTRAFSCSFEGFSWLVISIVPMPQLRIIPGFLLGFLRAIQRWLFVLLPLIKDGAFSLLRNIVLLLQIVDVGVSGAIIIGAQDILSIIVLECFILHDVVFYLLDFIYSLINLLLLI